MIADRSSVVIFSSLGRRKASASSINSTTPEFDLSAQSNTKRFFSTADDTFSLTFVQFGNTFITHWSNITTRHNSIFHTRLFGKMLGIKCFTGTRRTVQQNITICSRILSSIPKILHVNVEKVCILPCDKCNILNFGLNFWIENILRLFSFVSANSFPHLTWGSLKSHSTRFLN